MVLPIVLAVIVIATYFFTQSKSTARKAIKEVESNERIDKLKKEIKSKEKKGREEIKKGVGNYPKYQGKLFGENRNVKNILKKRNSKKSVKDRKEYEKLHGIIKSTSKESKEYQKRIQKSFEKVKRL
mgnify:CR=1 FL=1